MIRLVAFDLDGTLVDAPSSWVWVHRHFGESNDASLRLFLDGKIDDAEFIRRDIQLWWKHNPKISVDDIEEILAGVPLMPGARELFEGLHRRHLTTAIISGGIDLLAKRVGRELGVDYVLANGFAVNSEGRLTGDGHVRVPIQAKEAVLAQVQEQLGVLPDATASVGNSEIDVGLFRRSRIGIAFRPEDEFVRRHATTVITDGDLTGVLAALDGVDAT
ncbi:MAG: HAD-IB family phosphatase [Thermoplasmata archaeon]|nr:HAD-IB family phosphatase [Thermoplasmata archaeon]